MLQLHKNTEMLCGHLTRLTQECYDSGVATQSVLVVNFFIFVKKKFIVVAICGLVHD